MDLLDKLSILADAAKYDVSCSSSGSSRKNTPGGIGNGARTGICHSWSDDGRCISLLKILLLTTVSIIVHTVSIEQVMSGPGCLYSQGAGRSND